MARRLRFSVRQAVWCGLGCLWAVQAFAASTYYVSSAGDDNKPGTSVAEAKRTIAGALGLAETGDTIIVRDGTYAESGLDFAGRGIHLRSEHGPQSCIITPSDNAQPILRCRSSEAPSTLAGFTIRDCRHATGAVQVGGPAAGDPGILAIRNCIFMNNGSTSAGHAGAVDCQRSTLALVNCVFHHNRSRSRSGGGAVYAHADSNLTVIHCTFTQNASAEGAAGLGSDGTITATIRNSIFWDARNARQVAGGLDVKHCCVKGGYGVPVDRNHGVDPVFLGPDDFRLTIDSPCIDQGDNRAATGISSDLQGRPRCMDGDADGVKTVDIGAHEVLESFRWALWPKAKKYWFDCSTKARLQAAARVVDRVAEAGLNGIVLEIHDMWKLDLDERTRGNINALFDYCRAKGVEPVPWTYSVFWGHLARYRYASDELTFDGVNYVPGYPVVDAVYKVNALGTEARIRPDDARLLNPDFDEIARKRTSHFAHWLNSKAVGAVRQVTLNGQHAARLDKSAYRKSPGGVPIAFLYQDVEVEPRRQYHLQVRMALDQDITQGFFFANVVTLPGYRKLTYGPRITKARRDDPSKPAEAQPWDLDIVFNSKDAAKVRVSLYLWNVDTSPGQRKSANVYVYQARLQEVGLVNVLRRSGCPVVVKNKNTGQRYVEKQDFGYIRDRRLGLDHGHYGFYKPYHPEPTIEILRTEGRPRIPEGTELLVSYYHPLFRGGDITSRPEAAPAVDVCWVHPDVFAMFDVIMTKFTDRFGRFNYYYLTLNELRSGGQSTVCPPGESCGSTPGELLAFSTRRWMDIIKSKSPNARVAVWSDMFDEYHSADPESSHYYHVDGSLAGSWKGLHDDTIVVNWHPVRVPSGGTRMQSLKFFAGLGWEQLLGPIIRGAAEAAIVREFMYDASGKPEEITTPLLRGMQYTNRHDPPQDFELDVIADYDPQSGKGFPREP